MVHMYQLMIANKKALMFRAFLFKADEETLQVSLWCSAILKG